MALHIRLFGNLEIRRDGNLVDPFAARDAEALFCFLLVHRDRSFTREALGAALYPDATDPQKRIRTAIWRIRSVIDGEDDAERLRTDQRRVRLRLAENDWLDIMDFEGTRSHCDALSSDAPDLEAQLREAVSLYRGDLLEDHVDDWCFHWRERLKLNYLGLVERLMAHQAQAENWPAAITEARVLLQSDPLREHVHRDLMRFYYETGDRPAALAQFESLKTLLHSELGIGPMHETRALRDAMLAESIDRSKGAAQPPRSIDTRQLQRALACLDEARACLAATPNR